VPLTGPLAAARLDLMKELLRIDEAHGLMALQPERALEHAWEASQRLDRAAREFRSNIAGVGPPASPAVPQEA
jgi:hypothetical protein